MVHKTAIVTGGARGIGLSCVRRFIEDDINVVIADISPDLGASLAEEIVAGGGRCLFIECDVRNRLNVRNMIKRTLAEFGSIDILVNSAGIALQKPFLELSEEDFDRVLDVNLRGMFLVSQSVARQMVSQCESGLDAGSIVNMASISSWVASGDQLPYCVSKGGVAQLTRSMAIALSEYGIRVNAVAPGTVSTELLSSVHSGSDTRHKILSRTPLGRYGEVDEIAHIVSFLASSKSSFMTGSIVCADGGRMALNYTVPVSD